MSASVPGRILWLDILRTLCAVEIVGFHWLRALVKADVIGQNNPHNFVLEYRQLSCGMSGFHSLVLSDNPHWIPRFVDNLMGLCFEFGWEAVYVFVLLSGFSLSLTIAKRSTPPAWPSWLMKRLERILLPFYIISVPLVLIMLGLLRMSQSGFSGSLATKLTHNDGGDLAGILMSQMFLIDPRRHMFVPTFISPTWWFVPAILFAYIAFPLLWTIMQKLGPILTLIAALTVTLLMYTAIENGLLRENGWYFAAFNEAFTFSAGIVLGRLYATPQGATRIERCLTSKWAVSAGVLFVLIGNICNVYKVTYPISSSVFTIGLTLCGAIVARRLARTSFSKRIISVDTYVLYLVHQPFAFPIVALLLRLRFPDLPFFGFLLYLAATLLIASVVSNKLLPMAETALGWKSAAGEGHS